MQMQRNIGPIIIVAIVALVLFAAIGGGLYFVLGGESGNAGLTALTAEKNVISHEGFSLAAPPSAVTAGFRVGVDSVSASDFAQNTLADPDLIAARSALPAYLTAISSVHIIRSEGALPAQLTLAINVTDVGTETVDLYGWDGKVWNFLPSRHNGQRLVASASTLPKLIAAFQTSPTVQVVSTVLEVGDTVSEIGSTVNAVQVSGLTLQADGSLSGGLAGGFILGQGYAVMPLLRAPDDDGATLNAVMADLNAQRMQIGGIVDLVNSNDYNGVVLDYPGLDPARGAAFSQFVADLAAALHQQNKTLGVVAPTPIIENGGYTTGGYDLRSIGAAADIIELPLGDNLAAVGNGGAAQMIDWASGEVSRYKLRLLLSTLSADSSPDGSVARLPGMDTLALFGSATLQTDLAAIAPGSPVTFALTGNVQTLGYDGSAFAPRFSYLDDSGQARTVTYVTPETLTHQLALSQKYNLGGATVRDLFNPGNPAGMFDAVVQFKLKNAVLTTSGASLSYTVNGANGVVYQATAAPGQPFTWTAGEPGQYSVAANFDSSGSVDLGAVDVVVPQATAAATLAATATPKPILTVGPTSTPCPNCPTATPAPTKAPTAAPVTTGGGGAWGAFEFGGQVVHGGIPHAAEMKRAGMTWVKVQIYALGTDAAPAINNAHAQGFKILISFIEFSSASRATDPAYQQQVASYLGSVAGQGADAIEVWNEANLDRDWPAGQTTGAAYTGMLQKAYAAIKSANRNTIVVSGAPAPTGSNGGGCGAFCDDKPWLEQFAAAGGLNYTDCVGIHYNEGIVSPREIGTDPRDNHYTRYYQTMVNTYASIIGNARPLCFTELGFLTGEGYPDLASTAPGFAWAAGNTIAEQSQWLVEVVQMAKGGSAIRFVIVFNVDYTDYGADPKAGYAIIRADGNCPACDALDAVLP